MSLQTIYVTRHGFRSNWVVDPKTGTYSASIPSPTGIPSDPSLAGYGVTQSQELALHLSTINPPINRFYSSPFYRCLQTIQPTLDILSKTTPHLIHGEPGLGEWYGTARFDHPQPATPSLLHTLFPSYNLSHKQIIKPSIHGETISSLHNRVAYTLHKIIQQCDAEGIKTICICTHAATYIAIGRVLTGRMPEDIEEEDFRPFTCGVSTFERKGENGEEGVEEWNGEDGMVPEVRWKEGRGVGGGWRLSISGDCSFLSGGEERGWRFSGDESFVPAPGQAPALDAGSGLGVIIEGHHKPSSSKVERRTSNGSSHL